MRRFRLVEDPDGPLPEGLLNYLVYVLDERFGEGDDLRNAIPQEALT